MRTKSETGCARARSHPRRSSTCCAGRVCWRRSRPRRPPPSHLEGALADVKELVEYMARQLVDDPAGVSVDEIRHGDRVTLRLHVAEGDMGRVIGKQGRIAQAMRSLVKVAAAQQRVFAILEIG